MSDTFSGEPLAGVPDGFGRLWTPHRLAYIDAGSDAFVDACPFCSAPELSDEDGLIVYRGSTAFVVMNLYPYNGGHVLVCPYRHVAAYDELTVDEVAEIARLTQRAIVAIRSIGKADGFNIGINQGAVAGAGVPLHLHQHVVPRWQQDTNFLPVVARTRALPHLLGETRELLASAWPQDS